MGVKVSFVRAASFDGDGPIWEFIDARGGAPAGLALSAALPTMLWLTGCLSFAAPAKTFHQLKARALAAEPTNVSMPKEISVTSTAPDSGPYYLFEGPGNCPIRVRTTR